MVWSWSHTNEAYNNAYQNVQDQSREWLEVCYAEIQASSYDPEDRISEPKFNETRYEIELKTSKEMPSDVLADAIWDFASEQALCDNGGFNAWCCPYGCHKVPFDRGEEDELESKKIDENGFGNVSKHLNIIEISERKDRNEARMFTPPVIGSMMGTLGRSLDQLRDEISDVKLGPIEGDEGYFTFMFRGQKYKASEPKEHLIGFNKLGDKRLALRSLLDDEAVPIDESGVNDLVDKLLCEGYKAHIIRTKLLGGEFSEEDLGRINVVRWQDLFNELRLHASRLYGREGRHWRIVHDDTVYGGHVVATKASGVEGETLELR